MKNVVLLVLLFPCSVFAQKQLVVGDTVPDLSFHHVFNYKDSTARLSDFKNKAVVLVFWGTWNSTVSPKVFPMMNLLNKYKDIQPIFISYDPKGKVNTHLKAYKSNGLSLISTSDGPGPDNNRALLHYFPHETEPCYVLIDKDRIIRGIKRDGNVTSIDIRRLLGKENITDPEAFDSTYTAEQIKSFYGWDRNFMADLTMGNDEFVLKDFKECCIFTSTSWDRSGQKLFAQQAGYTADFTQYGKEITPNSVFLNRKVRAINWAPEMLYRLAYWREVFPDHLELATGKRVIVEIKDTVKAKLFGKFSRELCYCYLRITKTKKTLEELGKIMQQDLENFFGVSGRVEKRVLHCYAIVVKDTTLALSKGGVSTSKADLYGLQFTNKPVEWLAVLLRNYNENTNTVNHIIVNETNWKANIDLQLDCKLDDMSQVKTELQKHGLDLIEKDGLVPVIVVTDADAKIGSVHPDIKH